MLHPAWAFILQNSDIGRRGEVFCSLLATSKAMQALFHQCMAHRLTVKWDETARRRRQTNSTRELLLGAHPGIWQALKARGETDRLCRTVFVDWIQKYASLIRRLDLLVDDETQQELMQLISTAGQLPPPQQLQPQSLDFELAGPSVLDSLQGLHISSLTTLQLGVGAAQFCNFDRLRNISVSLQQLTNLRALSLRLDAPFLDKLAPATTALTNLTRLQLGLIDDEACLIPDTLPRQLRDLSLHFVERRRLNPLNLTQLSSCTQLTCKKAPHDGGLGWELCEDDQLPPKLHTLVVGQMRNSNLQMLTSLPGLRTLWLEDPDSIPMAIIRSVLTQVTSVHYGWRIMGDSWE